jgi:hypothetical protein
MSSGFADLELHLYDKGIWRFPTSITLLMITLGSMRRFASMDYPVMIRGLCDACKPLDYPVLIRGLCQAAFQARIIPLLHHMEASLYSQVYGSQWTAYVSLYSFCSTKVQDWRATGSCRQGR